MKKCGIYKITSPNGKIYIGQSIDIDLRWHHYKLLRNKNQKKLYASFLKYGTDNHKFEIIELCDKEQLNKLEKKYVDEFKTFGTKIGLNIQDGGGHGAKRKIFPENTMIECACNCGEKLWKYDNLNRERKYFHGHNPTSRFKNIMELFNAPITIQQAIKKLNSTSSSIKTIFSKLAKQNKIKRIGHGIYCKIGTPDIRENKFIKCMCGCKNEFLEYDKHWRKRQYISGHNFKNK